MPIILLELQISFNIIRVANLIILDRKGVRKDDFMKMSVLVMKEGDWWVAQCLEYDIAAQAKSLHDLQFEFQRIIVAHIVISLENKLKPFEHLPAAPDEYWKKYEKDSVRLETGKVPFRLPETVPSETKIPINEMRVC